MIRVVISFLCLSCQILIIECKFIDIDFAWDKRLRLMNEEYKCGIENKYKDSGTARIINGKRTSNTRYPWMAEILLIVEYHGKVLEAFGGGSIVSDKAILTCAHVLCLKPYNSDGTPQKPVTCMKSKNANQNRPKNHLHYSIGKMDIKDNIEYNKDILAFIYKYEPKYWNEGNNHTAKLIRRTHYKNGDVGLIINKSKLGLNLIEYKAIPVCLPTPESFEREFKVTMVGRGNSYIEAENDPSINTCRTNGNRVGNELPNQIDNSLLNFAPCKEYKREDKEKTCLNWNDAVIKRDGSNVQNGYRKEFVSTNMKIDFTTMGTTSDRFMTVNLPSGDKCEELSDRIAAVIEKLIKEKTIKISNDEEHGPSRVVVFDENENVDFENQYNDWKTMPELQKGMHSTYCYNIKTVASYGVCQTLLDPPLVSTSQDNYGFCGSSCMTPNIFNHFHNESVWEAFQGVQWEMEAKYYEMKTTRKFGIFCFR